MFMLSSKALVNGGLLVVKFWESQKLRRFSAACGVSAPNPCVVEGSTVKADLESSPVDLEACHHFSPGFLCGPTPLLLHLLLTTHLSTEKWTLFLSQKDWGPVLC